MFTARKMLLASAVAAIAFASLQSFTSVTPALECFGYDGYCRITLPDGTVIESPGRIRVVDSSDRLPAQDASRTVACL